MNEQWQKIKEWYLNLNTREKNSVMIGGILLSLFLIYEILWSPLNQAAVNARTKIETEKKLLVWMQGADKQLQQTSDRGEIKNKVNSPVMLLNYLQTKINAQGLAQYMTQLKQANNESINLQFQKVSFDKFIVLMTAATKEQNIKVTQLSIIPMPEVGLVNIDMMISL